MKKKVNEQMLKVLAQSTLLVTVINKRFCVRHFIRFGIKGYGYIAISPKTNFTD